MSDQFSVSFRITQNTAVIRLGGFFRQSLVGQFSEVVSAAEAGRPEMIVLDLEGLTLVDSGALGHLSTFYRRCVEQGMPLRFVNVQPGISQLLHQMRLTKVLDCDDVGRGVSEDPDESIQVMVIDTEPLILELISTVLIKAGYVVVAAATPSDALALYKDYHGLIQLVLVDKSAPGVRGGRLIDQLREIDDSVAVVVMGAMEEKALTPLLEIPNVVGILPKPFQSKDLVTLVGRQVRKAE